MCSIEPIYKVSAHKTVGTCVYTSYPISIHSLYSERKTECKYSIFRSLSVESSYLQGYYFLCCHKMVKQCNKTICIIKQLNVRRNIDLFVFCLYSSSNCRDQYVLSYLVIEAVKNK